MGPQWSVPRLVSIGFAGEDLPSQSPTVPSTFVAAQAVSATNRVVSSWIAMTAGQRRGRAATGAPPSGVGTCAFADGGRDEVAVGASPGLLAHDGMDGVSRTGTDRRDGRGDVDAVQEFVTVAVTSPWMWLVLLLVCALDALFPPLPSDEVVVGVAAVAASTGAPTLWSVVLVATVGAVIGDNLVYGVAGGSGSIGSPGCASPGRSRRSREPGGSSTVGARSSS